VFWLFSDVESDRMDFRTSTISVDIGAALRALEGGGNASVLIICVGYKWWSAKWLTLDIGYISSLLDERAGKRKSAPSTTESHIHTQVIHSTANFDHLI
jgi:hypothetical protein